ncbi:hypothetical protein LT350_31330 [Mycolicibacterium smegmatis]|uniref:hypothetical protein n=1 Tax=Mycolicibacterium smegmatis TaxID=1772 RepID=UPI001E659F89|nr:hypothetical protein [Mycolicibacterium smegmatis]UGU30944.1 hypothetical protein LT350_31330 [Mycolicibacterium smegmatis]ULN71850.1 hypothetical protein KZ782_08100 [Mycolicibacterium smegmatis]
MGSHRAATKAASTKYAGYVGGAAVALGVGAAIAVAGQGTAHADTDSGSAKTSSKESSKESSTAGSASRGSSGVNAGPKADTKSGTKADTKTGSKTGSKAAGKTERPRPLSKVSAGVQKAADKAGKDIKKAVDTAAARAEKAAARTEKVGAHVSGQINSQINKAAAAVSKSVTDSLKPVTGTVKPVTKDALKDFEAEQIARLKEVFTPKEAAAPNTEPEAGSALEKTTPTARATADTQVGAQADAPADPPWSPNPLRPDDPDPTDFPDAIMDLRDALLGASPEFLDPLVREATEQIYRGSQIVPWVNAVIPISKILPNLAPALGDDDAARDARQLIITELIKTTPPGSALYYGYDIIADLINLETPAAELKYGAVATVWNILDPLQLVHNKDKAVGIGSAAG